VLPSSNILPLSAPILLYVLIRIYPTVFLSLVVTFVTVPWVFVKYGPHHQSLTWLVRFPVLAPFLSRFLSADIVDETQSFLTRVRLSFFWVSWFFMPIVFPSLPVFPNSPITFSWIALPFFLPGALTKRRQPCLSFSWFLLRVT